MILRTTQDLAHLIRDRRSKKLLTQAALAQRVGVSRKSIVDLEGGKKTADISLILRTIRALGMDLEVHERPGKSDKTGVDIDSVVDKSTKTKR
jgi:y4mF family transcriptional regulator